VDNRDKAEASARSGPVVKAYTVKQGDGGDTLGDRLSILRRRGKCLFEKVFFHSRA
jgi:hypothetical protein